MSERNERKAGGGGRRQAGRLRWKCHEADVSSCCVACASSLRRLCISAGVMHVTYRRMNIVSRTCRVAGVLDSGAEGPGFKSQPRRCPITVFGKLFTPIVPLFSNQQNW